MTPAFWLCLLLVIASGLSAYIGNEWGRKLGKRKLSIFRLRPKHSSVFITVLLSMCLSLGLMGVLFTAVPSLQNAFFTPDSGDANQKAFEHYENALQLANGRLQRLAKTDRSESIVLPEAPPEKVALATPSVASAAPPASQIQPKRQIDKPIPQKVTPRKTAPQATPPPQLALAPLPQKNLQQATQQNTQQSSTQRISKSRLKSRRERSAVHAEATPPIKLSAAVAPVSEPSYPTGTLFELTVNGELNTEESTQLRQGVQRLTQDYLSLLGVQEDVLSFKSAQLQQEILKLNVSGQYRLQIALSPSQGKAIPVNVSVSKLNNSPESVSDSEAFDPQYLLEEQRLNSGSTPQVLQQDLQAVLKKHAKQQQIALKIAPHTPERTQSAQLPFDVLNVVNQNGVIRGELFLR